MRSMRRSISSPVAAVARVVDGLTEGDDAALVVKGRETVQVGVEEGLLRLPSGGSSTRRYWSAIAARERSVTASAISGGEAQGGLGGEGPWAGSRRQGGEDVALTPCGLDCVRPGLFQLAAQAADVDVDDIGAGVEMQVPDVFQKLHAGHHLACIAGEVGQISSNSFGLVGTWVATSRARCGP